MMTIIVHDADDGISYLTYLGKVMATVSPGRGMVMIVSRPNKRSITLC